MIKADTTHDMYDKKNNFIPTNNYITMKCKKVNSGFSI